MRYRHLNYEECLGNKEQRLHPVREFYDKVFDIDESHCDQEGDYLIDPDKMKSVRPIVQFHIDYFWVPKEYLTPCYDYLPFWEAL